MTKQVVSDLGERKLVARIREITRDIGGKPIDLSDAAQVLLGGQCGKVFVSTDPSPVPCLVHKIGMGDYYHSGWLAVLKSLSDLAAAAVLPRGVLIAADFSPRLLLDDFDRFFYGAAECARAHDTLIVGGNLRQTNGPESVVAFALGTEASPNLGLRRGVAQIGDVLFIVDNSAWGCFWGGITLHYSDVSVDSIDQRFRNQVLEMALKPLAKIRETQAIAVACKPTFSMDNSDGLLDSARQMASLAAGTVRIRLERNKFTDAVLSVSEACGGDPRIWGLSWGGSEILCAVPRLQVEQLQRAMQTLGIELTEIGVIEPGRNRVLLEVDNGTFDLTDGGFLLGEQFLRSANWSLDMEKHMRLMMTFDLDQVLVHGDFLE